MKVTKEILGDKVKLTIEVEAGLLKNRVDEVYNQLSKNIKIAGFRPGKAPRHLIEMEIGQDRLTTEVLDTIIPETYYEAVNKENLNVVGSPEVKLIKFVPTDGLTYEATVELLPVIKLPDLSKIKVKRETPEVKNEDIQIVLDDLAKQLAKTSRVERPAKKGDKIEINFEGFIDGLSFEGGKSENHPLVLGEGQLVPGFEEKLVGMRENDESEIEITFPKDYHAANLAGKTASFKVKMNIVNEIILPELNDEFAKQVGPFSDIKKLKEDIKRELMNTKKTQERNRVESEILEKIVEQIKVTAPDSLIHQEAHRLLHEAEHNLTNQGMTLDQYLKMAGKNQEELEKEMLPEAEKRVKIGLVLTELAKDTEVKIDDRDLHAEIKKRLERTNPDQIKEAEEFYDSPEGHQQIENMLIGEKVVNYLFEKCSA